MVTNHLLTGMILQVGAHNSISWGEQHPGRQVYSAILHGGPFSLHEDNVLSRGSSEQWPVDPGYLLYRGDYTPSYMGIVISHYKNPY